MPNLSPDEARGFIAEVRKENGGITPENRDFLKKRMPEVLEALQNTRRQLADSIKMYLTLSL